MDVTTRTTKLAWIRDPDVPAGQPALGRFNCPCGTKIEGVSFGAPRDHQCAGCGNVYDARGWLMSEGI